MSLVRLAIGIRREGCGADHRPVFIRHHRRGRRVLERQLEASGRSSVTAYGFPAAAGVAWGGGVGAAAPPAL